MATQMTADQRLEQLEEDVSALAKLVAKTAGATPSLVAILARSEAHERRPHLPDETREAA
jgi:hypothetical protein